MEKNTKMTEGKKIGYVTFGILHFFEVTWNGMELFDVHSLTSLYFSLSPRNTSHTLFVHFLIRFKLSAKLYFNPNADAATTTIAFPCHSPRTYVSTLFKCQKWRFHKHKHNVMSLVIETMSNAREGDTVRG